jgi:hypothetical protein
MPKDNPAAYGPDPFGQFLMQAYLSGAMPGGQGVSNFNTVLDLLSPGAVAGREEAGVPNAAEYFANMFGGTNVSPEMLQQGQEQAMGLRTTPAQKLEGQTELNKALLPFITGQGQLGLQRELGEAELGLKGRELDIKEQLVPLERQKTQAQINQANSLSEYYKSQSQNLKRTTDVNTQSDMFRLNIQSLAMYGQPWDFQAGGPTQGVNVDPKQLQAAQALAGIQRQNPNVVSTMNTLLSHEEPEMQAMGRAMLQEITGVAYDPGTWAGLFTDDNFWGQVVSPGGANQQAIQDEIARLEQWLPVANDPKALQAQIDQLKAQLGQ